MPVSQEERARAYGALRYWIEPGVGQVEPGSPAAAGGIEAGDLVSSADGEPIQSWWDFVRLIEERPGERTELRLERDGGELVRYVTPEPTQVSDPVSGEVTTVGKVGIYPPAVDWLHQEVSLADALAEGFRETVATTSMILAFLRDLFTGNVSPRSMGSIVTIGEASGQAASLGLETFLRFLALFSVNLAVLNLLPIPILDGGHLLFLAIEAVRGKALSVEQRLRWSNVGFLIVMGIMIWALSNDVLRLFGL
jgi:regulator of sigma E protease